jgi:hypothetical protein
MMHRLWSLGLILLASPAVAQNPAPARQELMRQVTERFMENYRQQAGLTPEQNQRFRTIAQRTFQQRRQRQQREQQLWRALELQMRPGMAANPDSVTKLLDEIVASRATAVEEARSDQKEFATFLSPVQRAQLFLAFERLQRNIQNVLQRRLQRGGAALDDQSPPN